MADTDIVDLVRACEEKDPAKIRRAASVVHRQRDAKGGLVNATEEACYVIRPGWSGYRSNLAVSVDELFGDGETVTNEIGAQGNCPFEYQRLLESGTKWQRNLLAERTIQICWGGTYPSLINGPVCLMLKEPDSPQAESLYAELQAICESALALSTQEELSVHFTDDIDHFLDSPVDDDATLDDYWDQLRGRMGEWLMWQRGLFNLWPLPPPSWVVAHRPKARRAVEQRIEKERQFRQILRDAEAKAEKIYPAAEAQAVRMEMQVETDDTLLRSEQAADIRRQAQLQWQQYNDQL